MQPLPAPLKTENLMRIFISYSLDSLGINKPLKKKYTLFGQISCRLVYHDFLLRFLRCLFVFLKFYGTF